MKKIKKVLIANRGEPVRRAIRTLKRMNLEAVTVVTQEDQSSDWVSESHQCLLISSYLNGDEIIKNALLENVDAIWPGWGFLSENANFAKAVEDSGLIWIGPNYKIIDSLGSKAKATELAKAAKLQTIPEVSIDVCGKDAAQTLTIVEKACHEIGFPILLKPALGGGGQGQKVLFSEDNLQDAWEQVVSINATQFQEGPILVQKYFDNARHIEAQVLSDHNGNHVVLGERECTIQRRNQKVIEEAPSKVLDSNQREKLIQDSARFAKQIGYDSAGTIEYLFSEGKFFFLEMNTRLQVEHPVTEETIRIGDKKIDLLKEMILIACGESLQFTQDEVTQSGSAIESRIYAEDVEKDFRPAPGKITYHKFPHAQNIRVETAFTNQPSFVSENYDPMIAKIISWGENREQAIARLDRALQRTVILGVPTNINLNRNILNEENFQNSEFSTRYLDQDKDIRHTKPQNLAFLLAVAAVLKAHFDRQKLRNSLRSQDPTSVHHVMNQIPAKPFEYSIQYQGQNFNMVVAEEASQCFHVTLLEDSSDFHFDLELVVKSQEAFTVILPNRSVQTIYCDCRNDSLQIHLLGQTHDVQITSLEGACDIDPHAAPMTGKIVKISVDDGQSIQKGTELYQIESMKMITSVRAVHAGEVSEIAKSVNDAIQPGDKVVQVQGQSLEEKPDANLVNHNKLKSLSRSVDPLQQVLNFFKGYDVSQERFQTALQELTLKLQAEKEFSKEFLETLVDVLKVDLTVQKLFQKNEHVMTFLIEQEDVAVQTLPKASVQIVSGLLKHYGHSRLSELSHREQILLRMFQSYKTLPRKKIEAVCDLLRLTSEHKLFDQTLTEPLKEWLSFRPELNENQKDLILLLLYVLDPKHYYKLGGMPVALEFFEDYKRLQKDPSYGLDLLESQNLLQEIETNNATYYDLNFEDFPNHLQPHLKKWFQKFQGRRLTLPNKLTQQKVFLFELVSADPKERDAIPPRFIVIVLVNDQTLKKHDDFLVLAEYEKAAIAAYQTLRLVQKDREHSPNNVFLLSEGQTPIPWRTRDGEQDPKSINPQILKLGASRVSGFASGIHIQATEVVIPLLNEDDGKVELSVIEIRHAKDKYILSRPPYPIHEREIKKPQDRETQMNEKQHAMGKLLNPDRCFLLFDHGQYEELFFPEVDDEPGIGLNVYKGKVNGVNTIAYAGDFRFRGGALGEREGKKLASAVVLAYISNCTLVAFHDGAGANIKESVSSLGWAGAYFGAIAHTGGFSTKEKFISWYENHINRDYFDKVLDKFDVKNNWHDRVNNLKNPFLHFHLHVGATVGMLVYGAAIAHLSLMVDQPEAYRVLTGAGTVKKVLGEAGTNYSLGGAKAHFQKSGDIEMIFKSEEAVIDKTRRLVELFHQKPKADLKIERSSKYVALKLPKRAGVILSRDGLKAHIDNGEFFEIRRDLEHATNLLTGYASLAGYPLGLAVTATDYGVSHAKGFQKIMNLAESAQDNQIPFLAVCGAQWEAASLPVSENWLLARKEFYKNLERLTIPKISLALGPRSIEQSLHDHMDIVCYVKRGNESEDELQRVLKLCPFIFEDLAQAFDDLPKILALFRKPFEIKNNSETKNLKTDLPEDIAQAYDMHNVLDNIFDNNSFLEFFAKDNLPLIVGLARLSGRTVGVIADNPQVESGAQNRDAILKFTKINRIAERWNLPIIEISDSPAFRPGHEQEHGGIQGVGGRSIREECLSRNPKRVVTLRQNYGGRFIHANLVTLGLPRKGFALKNSRIGVMGAKGAVGVLYRKQLIALEEDKRIAAEKKLEIEYENQKLNPKHALDLNYIEKLIDVDDIRLELIESLKS